MIKKIQVLIFILILFSRISSKANEAFILLSPPLNKINLNFSKGLEIDFSKEGEVNLPINNIRVYNIDDLPSPLSEAKIPKSLAKLIDQLLTHGYSTKVNNNSFQRIVKNGSFSLTNSTATVYLNMSSIDPIENSVLKIDGSFLGKGKISRPKVKSSKLPIFQPIKTRIKIPIYPMFREPKPHNINDIEFIEGSNMLGVSFDNGDVKFKLRYTNFEFRKNGVLKLARQEGIVYFVDDKGIKSKFTDTAKTIFALEDKAMLEVPVVISGTEREGGNFSVDISDIVIKGSCSTIF